VSYALLMAPDTAPHPVVGVWRLISYEDRDSESDAWSPTFGANPRGIVVYHPSGVLSVQIAPAADDPEPLFAYVGYFGAYALVQTQRSGDEAYGVVEHNMHAAWPSELLAEAPERPFSVQGDRLTLGDGRTWRRVFERVT